MPDLSHLWGSDLEVGPTGDLALSDGLTLSNQRVLRRLMTSPGDYPSHPGYGAGLPRYIGEALDERTIAAVVRAQMELEATVARSPEPVIRVAGTPATNTVALSITYTYAPTGEPVTLEFSVSR